MTFLKGLRSFLAKNIHPFNP